MRISEVRRRLREEWGIDVGLQQLRRLQGKKLFRSERSENGNYRIYSEQGFNNLTQAVLLLELGVSYQAIKSNDTEAIIKRILFLQKIINQVSS